MTHYWGVGADTIIGGSGNDYYYYEGAGQADGDVIEDNGDTAADRIYFNNLTGVFDPVFGLTSGNTTDLRVTTEWGTLTIVNQFAADGSDRIEYLYGQRIGQSNVYGFTMATKQFSFVGDNTDEILTMPSFGLSASQDHRIYGMGGNDTLTGGTNEDYLYGGDGNDVLRGGAAIDYLIGDDGADRFIFEALTAYSGIDRIEDFTAGEGDIIDISDLLTAYDPLSDMIEDYVQILNSGANSILRVDVNGGGDSFVQIATLVGVTGLTDEQALIDSGSLVV